MHAPVEVIAEIACLKDGFSPTVLAHPDTYVNKVVIGSKEGNLGLWNFQSGKRVYMFTQLAGEGAVTACTPSPAIDVVAVGREDGTISLFHLRKDALVFKLKQDGVVTSLSFRTDLGAGNGVDSGATLASGSSTGRIWLWDLGTRAMQGELSAESHTGAHDHHVSGLAFLPGEPLLLTQGKDNSLKVWIFDSPDGSARLLRSRSGHSSPPKVVRWYGNKTLASMGHGNDASALQILAGGGSDRALRSFHAVRDCQSRELSQGKLLAKAKKLHIRPSELKLSPIVAMANAETRGRDWCDIVTAHERDACVYVWSSEKHKLGPHELKQPGWKVNTMSSEQDPLFFAVSVAISVCGNYALVGTNGGSIFKYNIQSGLPRGAYPKSSGKVRKAERKKRPGDVSMTAAKLRKALGAKDAKRLASGKRRKTTTGSEPGSTLVEGHSQRSPVTGVDVDGLNRQLISCSLDGYLIWWNFQTHDVIEAVDTGSPVARMTLARDSGLVAIGCDDCVIRVYDLVTRRLVRRLEGSTAHLTDMTFSGDGRRVYTAGHDASLRVWDLPTAQCVDWVSFNEGLGAVTSVSVSATGEFICTTHMGRLGIYLWIDRSLYDPKVRLESVPTKPTLMATPELVECGMAEVEDLDNGSDGEDESMPQAAEGDLTLAPKAVGALTLSGMPRSHWESLFHLDLVKARNKPTEAPKAPPRAPFFIPTARASDGLKPVFEKEEEEEENSSSASQAKSSGEEKKDGEQPPAAGWGEAWSDDDDDAAEAPALEDDVTENEPEVSSRILQRSGMKLPRCHLADLLQRRYGNDGHRGGPAPHDITGYLKSLTPAAVDVEMNGLCRGPTDEEGREIVMLGLDWLQEVLEARDDFEVVQAYLQRFLKIHGEVMDLDRERTGDRVAAMEKAQKGSSRHLRDLIHQNLCLINFFSNQNLV